MKISSLTKHLGMAILVLGLAAGCASTQEQQQTEQTEGPSDSKVEAAIQDARDTNQEARSMGADWRDARKLINEAETAFENDNNEQALNLAREARLTAEQNIEDYKEAQRNKEQQQAEQEEMESEPKMRTYTVERGDTLWGISASSRGYNDPYKWPLIYRANTDKIQDADLIYPEQKLRIRTNPSADQVDLAVEHAKNRGEWELGKVESADRKYLGKAGGM